MKIQLIEKDKKENSKMNNSKCSVRLGILRQETKKGSLGWG